jgi:hypothetical protein
LQIKPYGNKKVLFTVFYFFQSFKILIMKFNVLFGILLGFAFLLSTSCKKDDAIANEFITVSEDVSTQQDILEANESEVTDEIEIGLQAMTTRGFPTRTWTNPKGTFPNTLTIDYGTNGVTGPHGKVRKGKIIVQISAPLITVGSVRVVSHEDFFIDDVQVEGTVTLTNQGLNASNQIVFLRNVANRKLTFPSGKTISWNATQIITQVAGNNTPDIRIDDAWSISDVSNGVNRNGKSFTVSTAEALLFKTVCPWIVDGVLNITVETNTLGIDFGDGACNNAATVTLPDGSTKEINIRRWW